MTGFRHLRQRGVAASAKRLGVPLSDQALDDTVSRFESLGDIYEALETAIESTHDLDHSSEEFRMVDPSPTGENDPLNAWLSRFELERTAADGELSNRTVAIKDNMAVRGVELTCGSLACRGWIPGTHATVVDRLLNAGATIAGKTNMDEFAFGPTSETSAFGPTENPRSSSHVAGGSSSGSAAAVAAGDVDIALGTDTGGSVRIPASYCGIVGMKPTYGRIPLDGIVPLAATMDHVGVFARDVSTATRGLSSLVDRDRTASPTIDREALGTDLDSISIGRAPGFFERHTSEAVSGAIADALTDLTAAGADVVDVAIPALAHSREAWWGIAPTEFAAEFLVNGTGIWHEDVSPTDFAAQFAQVRETALDRLGSNIKEMLTLGTYLITEMDGFHYRQARELRRALIDGFESALADVDVLVAPGTPTTALEIGGFERGVTPPVNWVTHPTNLTGHPSVTIPYGRIDGLPVGLQFIGKMGADQFVLDVAHAAERLT